MNKCETRSALSDISRRNLLMLGGASAVAMPFAGIPGFVTVATGQETKPAAVVLPATHFLARAGIAGAAKFPIGNQALSLDLDPKSPHIGAVHEYTLPPKEAQVLGRKTSVIEATMTALTPNSPSMKVVHNALTAYKDLPPAITKTSNFVAVTTRRRVITPTTEADRLNISKELQTVEPVTTVVGFTADQSKGVTAYVLPPTVISLKTKKLLRPPILFVPNLGKSGGGAAPPQAAPPPAATPEEFDFAKCFLDCAAGLYGTAAPFIAAMTPACVTAIGLLPASAGISSVLAIPSCALDLVLLSAPIAICLAVCGVAAAAAG